MARKIYIGTGDAIKRDLPTGYTQIKYIESDGTQYIDTGFAPNQNTRVVMKAAITSPSGTTWYKLFGGNTSTSSGGFSLWRSGDGVYEINYGSNATYTTADTSTEISVDMNGNVVTINGAEYTVTAETFQASNTMYLFDINTYTGLSYLSGLMKLYSCQIYDNGTLVRDFVPCINSSGMAGLYDMVNNVFYVDGTGRTFTVGKTVTDDCTVRKVKTAYVGVATDMPVYEKQSTTVTITSSNINEYFTVTNGSYYFSGSGGSFTSTSASGTFSTSTATSTWVAKQDITSLSFNYSTSSSSSSCKLTVTVAGTTVVNGVSGTNSGSWSGSLSAGQSIALTYVKALFGSGTGTISNISLTYNKTVQVDTVTKSVAHRIRKAYIGIGGVARPCFGTGELTYYGAITNLSLPRHELAATTVGNYALFGGGYCGSDLKYSSDVDVYDTSLTHTTTALSAARCTLVATTVGNYAIFGGGYVDSDTMLSTVDAYDTSLTRTTPTSLTEAKTELAVTTVGNYALFGGGANGRLGYSSTLALSTVDAYDIFLTHIIPTSLSDAKYDLAATTVGNYALFGGGHGNDSNDVLFSEIDAYDTSLTRTTPTSLSESKYNLAAAKVGNYALFGGGSSSSHLSTVDAYDTSLTRTALTRLSEARTEMATTTVGNYALFGGGYSGSSTVDAYDTSLTHTTLTPLSKGGARLAATTVGNYALFGGGYINNSGSLSYSSTVSAYIIA